MKKKVLIVDTCLACVWRRIPGMEKAGSDTDCWDFNRVDAKIKSEIENGTLLILPLASFIETGNHITQIKGKDRMPYIEDFGNMIINTIDGEAPWVTYSNQNKLWEGDNLRKIVKSWIDMNHKGKHSFGDVSILNVATAYLAGSFEVEILTADSVLKAYENVDLSKTHTIEPRRRKLPK